MPSYKQSCTCTSTHLYCSHFYVNSERITLRQAQVDKLYAGLKDLAEERRGRLQERLRLTQLKREVDDLEQWIAEREIVAGSHELGQDYEHVTVSFFFLSHMLWRHRGPGKSSQINCFSLLT